MNLPLTLKGTLRRLRRESFYVSLNVTGLALGLACCFLLYLYVRHEQSYDRFHEKAERIVRPWTSFETSTGYFTGAAFPFAAAVTEAFAEVEAATRFYDAGTVLTQRGDFTAYEEGFRYADSTFLDVFSFQLLPGSDPDPLSRPFSIVLTPELARKYFGREDPIAQTLRLELVGKMQELTVTGLVETPPTNTHLSFTALISFDTYFTSLDEGMTFFADIGERTRTDWLGSLDVPIYLLLHPQADWRRLEPNLAAYARARTERSVPGLPIRFTYHLQPLTDIHFSQLGMQPQPEASVGMIRLLSLLAVLILGIACVNYVNLSLAQSSRRAREIGVRKALGASRKQVARQFIGEAVVMSILAFFLALLLTEALLPLFEETLGKRLAAHVWSSPSLLLTLLGISLMTGLAAGSYPALVLSGFSPVKALRGRVPVGKERVGLRRVLVVGQFVGGVVLIVGTLVVGAQLRYVQQKELGFDEEHLVQIPLRSGELRERADLLKEELRKLPGVVGATAARHAPPILESNQHIIINETPTFAATNSTDLDYAEVLGLKLVAGKWFESMSWTPPFQYVVNEAFARDFGLEEPIGHEVNLNTKEGYIIGVVSDHHYASLHKEIKPMIYYPQFIAWNNRTLLIKVAPGQTRQALTAMEQLWKQVAPEQIFTYSFLDDDLAAQYEAERRLETLFTAFSALGLLVACLGLFGLAAYSAQRRTKEVGIRKALGASVPGLITLLTKDFLRLVLIAFLLAVPLSYLAAQRWLEGFAYRVTLGPGVFLTAGAVAVGVALLTVSTQAWRAARTNPVTALRYE